MVVERQGELVRGEGGGRGGERGTSFEVESMSFGVIVVASQNEHED